MLELTEKEIDKISSDIEQQGLTYTLLKNEILDHICCNIEAEMEQGMTFNEAYKIVKGEMGKKRIRQIQDETLFLINKKYRRMKRLVNVLGVAVPIIIIIASIFKVMHWPGGGLLISLALFVTGAVFLPMFVMVRIRDTRKQDEPVPMDECRGPVSDRSPDENPAPSGCRDIFNTGNGNDGICFPAHLRCC